MATKHSETWPKRPKDFYEDWTVFCAQALIARLQQGDDDEDLAVVLLAAGAILGGAGMVAIVAANKEAIDAQGKEWGIPSLSAIASVGTAVLGAAVGGLGVAWLTRTLSKHADTAKVDALQARLSIARREFESLKSDRTLGRLDVTQHKLGVERLFHELVESKS